MAFPGMAWARRITEFDPTRLFITNVRPVEIGRLQTGSFQAQSGVGAWTRAQAAGTLTRTAQRRTETGLAVRIMRLSTWTAMVTSPC